MGVFASNSKAAKAGLLCAGAVGVAAGLAAGAVASTRIRTLCSLRKLSCYEGHRLRISSNRGVRNRHDYLR